MDPACPLSACPLGRLVFSSVQGPIDWALNRAADEAARAAAVTLRVPRLMCGPCPAPTQFSMRLRLRRSRSRVAAPLLWCAGGGTRAWAIPPLLWLVGRWPLGASCAMNPTRGHGLTVASPLEATSVPAAAKRPPGVRRRAACWPRGAPSWRAGAHSWWVGVPPLAVPCQRSPRPAAVPRPASVQGGTRLPSVDHGVCCRCRSTAALGATPPPQRVGPVGCAPA